MRKIIRQLFDVVGYDIQKKSIDGVSARSVKTNDLTLYNTLTGNYYLPMHAYHDIVANTIKSGQIFEKETVDIAFKYIKEDTAILDVGGLDTPKPYRDFEERVFKQRKNLLQLVEAIVADGKTIIGYVASTKGNVLLQFCGITAYIEQVGKFIFPLPQIEIV